MSYSIPAKTFFLGEYAALLHGPAILVTTTPCFTVSVDSSTASDFPFHPDSPAGRWWQTQACKHLSLQWHDPYQALGGLGASSAQFLGAYLASMNFQNKTPSIDDLLVHYQQAAWNGVGLSPSGYDVLAQFLLTQQSLASHPGFVYMHREKGQYQLYDWPFHDLAFILLHTKQKLATHHHLESIKITPPLNDLAEIVLSAKLAFEARNSERLIQAINDYHKQLIQKGLVAHHSLQLIQALKENRDILAIKGCGAMGSDVLLLLVPKEKVSYYSERFTLEGWLVLAKL